MAQIERRAFFGWLSSGFVAALLGGCGGGSRGKHTVRGIVLEDAGNGTVQQAGAGRTIYATYFDGPTLRERAKTTSDNQGKFAFDLGEGLEFILTTSSYPPGGNPQIGGRYPACATVPLIGFSFTGEKGIRYTKDSFYTRLPEAWSQRAQQYALQYDVDVVILAELACVGRTT